MSLVSLQQQQIHTTQNQLRLNKTFTNAENLPQVPVLVGPFAQCLTLWRTCGIATDVLRPASLNSVYELWCRTLLRSVDVVECASKYVCSTNSNSIEYIRRRLPGMDDTSFHELVRQVPFRNAIHNCVLTKILNAGRQQCELNTVDLLASSQQVLPEGECAIKAVLQALIEITGPHNSPCLLCVGAFSADTTTNNSSIDAERWLQTVVDLAVNVPGIRLGLTGTQTDYQAYLAQAPETFFKGVTQDVVISVPVATVGVTKDQLISELSQQCDRRRYTEPSELDQCAESLIQIADSDQLLNTAISLATFEPDDKSDDKLGAARSQAEAFLFSLLDRHAETAGCFQLNQKANFHFGNRPIEIDLAALDLQIAIEIDGYFHFQHNDNYRRDRRKDLLLQQHGFVVLRFLAEDIVPMMSEIVDTIVQTVKWIRNHHSTAPTSPSRNLSRKAR